MSKNKKTKPKNQDFVNAINYLYQENHNNTANIDIALRTLDLYINFKKDNEKFRQYIDKQVEQSQEKNELQKAGQDNKEPDNANSTD